MRPKLAILGVKTYPAFAGADRVVEQIVPGLAEHWDIDLYVVSGAEPPGTLPRGMRLVALPALRGKHLRAFSFFLVSTLRYLFGRRVDCVHVHNSDFGFFVPFLKLRRAPVVGTFHGNPYERAKWGRFAKWYLRSSERIFVSFCDALTSVAATKSSARGILSTRPVRFIPNGVDEAGVMDVEPLLRDWGVERGRFLLFACGRLDRTKGLHHLLDAYSQKDTGCSLVVVGDFRHDREYAESIERRSAERPGVVLHKSLLAREALLGVIAASRACVFPSEIEAMSMVLLEFLSRGRAVVCSDIPENLAVVGDDYPLSFRSADPSALRAKILLATTSENVVQAARAVWEARRDAFRWPEIAGEYRRIYADLLGAPGK